MAVQLCNEIVHPWDWVEGQTRWVCVAQAYTEHSHMDGLVNGTLRVLGPDEAVTEEDEFGCIWLAV